MANQKSLFDRRRQRNRTQIRKNSGGRPRLSVHRTGQHMYAQIIDDTKGVTLATASTLEADTKKSYSGNNRWYFSATGSLTTQEP